MKEKHVFEQQKSKRINQDCQKTRPSSAERDRSTTQPVVPIDLVRNKEDQVASDLSRS
jgi:hypothetical protein